MAEGSEPVVPAVISTEPSQSDKKFIDPSFGFRLVISGIQKKWPAVKNMSTVELEELISKQKVAGEQNVVVVDVRPVEEFNVSHIPSAVMIDWQTKDMTELRKIVQDRGSSANEPVNVVMYCSVGYRSTALAEKFRQSLKAEKKEQEQTPSPDVPSPDIRVFNLEGSLFKWANEGRELVDGVGTQTKFVHPYSVTWGLLANKDLRQWEGPHM